MDTTLNHPSALRRTRLFTPAILVFAIMQLGALGFASSQANAADVPASTIGAITPGSHTSFGPLKHVKAGLLDVSYAEVGPADGPVVILLHGWPYDIHSYADVAPALAEKGYRVLIRTPAVMAIRVSCRPRPCATASLLHWQAI